MPQLTGTHESATFPALGGIARVVTGDPRTLHDAQAVVSREVAAFDGACSRFRSDSDLSRVNASPGRWVPIGERLCDALDAALDAAVTTGGVVDPTVGGSLVALGYRHDFWTCAPSSEPAFRVAPAGRWREIELDRVSGRVRIPEGVLLDLGATAKALAADRAALAAAPICGGVLVSLGGDIRAAGEAPEAGWAVRIADDHRAPVSAPGQTIAISSGGVASSSTKVRAGTRGGVPVHHIVDPASGAPAVPVWRTVSVAAATCLEANVAATAAIVLGEGAPGWLAGRLLPSRLVRPAGDVIAVAGWPSER
ncbi:MAG: FAD:protein FMN transferase [Gaiellales bacterium]